MLIRPDAAADMLAERDQFRRGSPDWQWRNGAAWRFYMIDLTGALAGHGAPPADFGPHYLQHQHGIAAE